MSDIGTTAFNAIYGAMPEARATATFGRTVVARCLCSGVGQTRNPTEIGAGIEFDGRLHVLATDDPTANMSDADMAKLLVKVTLYGQTKETTYKIGSRHPMAGKVVFSLEYQHGQ
jgi:hypothetical protein